jgi:hypothetical protein
VRNETQPFSFPWDSAPAERTAVAERVRAPT